MPRCKNGTRRNKKSGLCEKKNETVKARPFNVTKMSRPNFIEDYTPEIHIQKVNKEDNTFHITFSETLNGKLNKLNGPLQVTYRDLPVNLAKMSDNMLKLLCKITGATATMKKKDKIAYLQSRIHFPNE